MLQRYSLNGARETFTNVKCYPDLKFYSDSLLFEGLNVQSDCDTNGLNNLYNNNTTDLRTPKIVRVSCCELFSSALDIF